MSLAPGAHPHGSTGPGTGYDTMLFGGMQGSFASPTYLGDTWSWNGMNWQEFHMAVAPPARTAAVMSLAPGAHPHGSTGPGTGIDVILFGGDLSSGLAGDTWSFDGTDWLPADFEADWTPYLDTALIALSAHDHDSPGELVVSLSSGIETINLPQHAVHPTETLRIVSGYVSDHMGAQQAVHFYYMFDQAGRPVAGSLRLLRACHTDSTWTRGSVTMSDEHCQDVEVGIKPYDNPRPLYVREQTVHGTSSTYQQGQS